MQISTKQLSTFEFELFKRFSSHDILPVANKWKNKLFSQTSAIKVGIAGELRRGRSSVSHIDVVVSTDNIKDTILEISQLSGIFVFRKQSRNVVEVELDIGIKILIWLTDPSAYATALLYTTGPVSHTDWLNSVAFHANKRVSFHGCWFHHKPHPLLTEADIYRFLDLPYFPPEVRENDFSNTNIFDIYFQDLIKPADIQSDLHMHTCVSDGKNTLEEMINAAIEQRLKTIAITDHSPLVLKPRYENPDYFLAQHKIIDDLQEKYRHQISILKGAEVDILPDGSLDLPARILKKMDIVVASLHVALGQSREVNTKRVISAIENPYVNIIGHPGGRLYPMHDNVELDWERIYHACAFNQVALEINSHKSHPLFDDQKVRAALNAGAPICLNSDAHASSMLGQSIFGLNIARRAMVERFQIINTWSHNHLNAWLRRKKLTAREQ